MNCYRECAWDVTIKIFGDNVDILLFVGEQISGLLVLIGKWIRQEMARYPTGQPDLKILGNRNKMRY